MHLLDLSNFFTDTDEPTTNLNYSVVKNTKKGYVDVYTNYSHILKISPILANWNGETEVMVQALDSGMKKSYSNQFKIIVTPVNDEPTPEINIPDITLVEGEQDKELDLELREYFSDIEDDLLYYKVALDPMEILEEDQKDIEFVLDDDNMLRISCIGDFNTYINDRDNPVPLWIYCDDDSEVNTLADKDQEGYIHQEIFVSILPINDPPKWREIPTVQINEDDVSKFTNCIDLYKYVSDDETKDMDMILEILGSNPAIELIPSGGELSINVPQDYFGSTIISVVATDEIGEKSVTNFELQIMPVNDRPEIEIKSHKHLDSEEGTIDLSGRMYDVENQIRLVEVKIESMESDTPEAEIFDWQRAELDKLNNNWTYPWDTTMVPDGEYKLTARVYDGALSDEEFVVLLIKNGRNFEPEVNVVYPKEGNTVNGTFVISGTVMDPDYHGIEELEIRVGIDMDWTEIPLKSKNETVWSFPWDSTTVLDGEINIYVKAFDGISWSVPASRMVVVDNGINTTNLQSGPLDAEKEDNTAWIIASILILIVVVLGLLVVASIVTRGKKKVHEYIPDGRMDPLDDLEAAVKPALGPGVSIEHAPLPGAAPAAAASLPPVPAAGAGATPGAAMPLPAAQIPGAPVGAPLPALPPKPTTTAPISTATPTTPAPPPAGTPPATSTTPKDPEQS
jgi:hypothetical protein